MNGRPLGGRGGAECSSRRGRVGRNPLRNARASRKPSLRKSRGDDMRLAQIIGEDGKRALVVTARGESRLVKGARTTLQFAEQAIEAQVGLRKLNADRGVGKALDLTAAYKEKRVLAPVDHPDPAHVYVTGTGLTHLGS